MAGLQLHKVLAGQPITADWANSLVDAVNGLQGIRPAPPLQGHVGPGGLALGIDGDRHFDLIELQDTIQANDFDKSSNLFTFNSANTPTWFQKLDGAGASVTLGHTADAMQSLYLAGERHLAYFHPAAGQRIPLPGVQFHIGKLSETLAAGGSASVEVWRVDSGTAADSGYAVTAHDWMLPSGASLAAGTPVSLFQHPQSKLWFVFAEMAGYAAAYGGYWMNASPQSLTGLGLQLLAWDYHFGEAGLATSGVTYDVNKQTITVQSAGIYLAIASLHLAPGWTSAGPSSPTNTIQFDTQGFNAYLNGGSSYVWDSGVVGYRWEVTYNTAAPVSGGYATLAPTNPITNLPPVYLTMSGVFSLAANDQISVQVNLTSYSGKPINFPWGQLTVARIG